MKKMSLLNVCFVAAMVFISSSRADAFLDLTAVGSSGYLNNAYFAETDAQPTGTGNINSFVRIQTNDDVEEGYNTSGRSLLFDENNSPQFTRDLLLSEVPVVFLLNQQNALTPYREFLLDINQNNCPKKDPGCSDKFLSLDELKIYLGASGGLLESNPDNLGNLIFNLTEDNIKLNYALNHGSGSGDMFAYIPDSLFTGSNRYVYLYSKFGEEFSNTAGFEEWAVLDPSRDQPTIPEPASLFLLGSGLAASFFRRKVR